jgi:hypothetical protein
MTNTPGYNSTKSITTVKSFIAQAQRTININILLG